MEKCSYCGSFHASKCALVKSFEYFPDGTIKKVEFYTPQDYVPSIFNNPGTSMPRLDKDIKIT